MGVPSEELLRGVEPVRPSRRKLQNKHKLFLMALPFLVVTFIFYYLPISGWIYAFYDFIPGIPLSDTPYVGLKWFRTMVSNPTQTAEVLRVLKNTVVMSSLGLITSVFPVIFAILLTEIKSGWYRKFVQTLTTIPNFISWILVYALAFSLFSVDSGVVSGILVQLGIVDEGYNFLASSSNIWVTMIAWYWWKSLGWGQSCIWRRLQALTRSCMKRQRWTEPAGSAKSGILPCPVLSLPSLYCCCSRSGTL